MNEKKFPEYGWDPSMGVSLYNKIRQDNKTAMLSRNTLVRDTMRLIMGDLPNLTVAITLEDGKKTTRPKKPEEITDEELQDIIRRFIKSEKINLDLLKKDTSDYLELLKSYLPKMADQDEIIAWIRENIDFKNLKSSMQAMGPIMKHFGKTADGAMVQEILKTMSRS